MEKEILVTKIIEECQNCYASYGMAYLHFFDELMRVTGAYKFDEAAGAHAKWRTRDWLKILQEDDDEMKKLRLECFDCDKSIPRVAKKLGGGDK